MHVEISVALNFVISYMYNKLPRRRVDLFGDELEAGLKRKFEGHWYPNQPNKGSGYRCVKGNGDEVDNVIVEASNKAGLDLEEVKSYLPDDLTLWIDPSEVSYKIGERGQVKILYNDRKEEDGVDNTDKEVQAASRTFNPEAQSFNPEAQSFNPDVQSFTPEVQSFTPDAQSFAPEMQSFAPEMQSFAPEAQSYAPDAQCFNSDVQSFTSDVLTFCTDSSQSFQPIDSLSSSLSNLSLSPSSPLPPGTWSTATSPSSSLYSFDTTNSSSATMPTAAPAGYPGGPKPVSAQHRPQFTAAMFAQTKFGSTKLKTQAKRPNRLSPTEFSHFFNQQQKTTYSGPQRPRSLSPRDPRVEFMIDQQHRMYLTQQQQQQHQISPSLPYGPQYHHQQQQQLSPTTGLYPDFMRQHSSGISSNHSSPHLSPHLSPHMSPQGTGPTFQDLIPPPSSSVVSGFPTPATSSGGLARPNSLSRLNRPSNHHHHHHLNGVVQGFGGSFTPGGGSSLSQPGGSLSHMNAALSPDAPKTFVDGLNMPSVNYSNNLQHLLMAN